jgi:hypothetical protein
MPKKPGAFVIFQEKGGASLSQGVAGFLSPAEYARYSVQARQSRNQRNFYQRMNKSYE